MALTVKDLIQKLSGYPGDLRVLVEGYEGGFSEIQSLKQIHVALNRHQKDWMGPHEEDQDSKDSALVILRGSNPNAV